MMGGGALGLAAGAVMTALMYCGLLTMPAPRPFAVTSGLITLLAAGLASQAIAVDIGSSPTWPRWLSATARARL